MRQLTVRTQAKARADLELYTRWYAERSLPTARKLKREIQTAVRQIRNFPRSAPKMIGDVRRVQLNSSPLGLAYRVEEDAIVIIAIAHDRQKPGLSIQD